LIKSLKGQRLRSENGTGSVLLDTAILFPPNADHQSVSEAKEAL